MHAPKIIYILGILKDDCRPETAQTHHSSTFMDEEDGCSIDLYL